ncbi:MAG: hypothetical protein PVF05_10195 [Gemmatimonadales bacterium]|jgi:TolB-like protein
MPEPSRPRRRIEHVANAIPWSTIGQVVGVYVAGSWVLLQVVDVLLNNLDLPSWLFRTVLGLLIVGFPITLSLALLFRKRGEASRLSLRRSGAALLVLATVAVLLTAVPGLRRTGRRALLGADLPGVAILPFRFSGPDAGQAYLADQISLKLAEAVQRTGVFSPGWPAVERFHGELPPLAQIGHELNVQYILVGTLIVNGDSRQLSVWLMRARDNTSVWQETFDGVRADLADFEFQIARTVIDSLSSFVDIEPGAVLVRRYTTDLVADSLYSRGLYLVNQYYDVDSTRTAAELFGRSIERDSAFAPGYVALAGSISALSRVWWQIPPAEAGPRIRSLLDRAQRLAPELVDVKRQYGWYYYVFGWDWNASNVFLSDAIARNPRDTYVRIMLPFTLLVTGQPDSAIATVSAASSIEPHNPLVVSTECWMLYLVERYDRAARRCQFVLDSIQPRHGAAVAIGRTIEFSRRFLGAGATSAARDSAAADLLAGWTPPTTALEVSGEMSLALRLAELGHDRDARRALAADMALPEIRPLRVANVYAALGEMDTAWEWLERAYDARDPFLAEIDWRPEMAPFRADQRYAEFKERMRLP